MGIKTVLKGTLEALSGLRPGEGKLALEHLSIARIGTQLMAPRAHLEVLGELPEGLRGLLARAEGGSYCSDLLLPVEVARSLASMLQKKVTVTIEFEVDPEVEPTKVREEEGPGVTVN